MKTINIDEITSDMETKGIKIIPIGYSKPNASELKGDLENFIATVKAFGESIVFLQEFPFDSESFLHEQDEEIVGEYNEPASEDGISLTQFLPVSNRENKEPLNRYIFGAAFSIV